MNEDLLRRALQDEASSVSGGDGDGAWRAVQGETARRRSVRRRRVGGGLAVALVVLGGGGLVARVQDGDGGGATTVAVGPDGSSTSTSTSTSTTVAPPGAALDAVWPFTTEEQLQDYREDPGIGMFFDAEATALEFARTYLEMPDPRAVGVEEDGDSVFVDVTATPDRPMVTTIWVRDHDGIFLVVRTETANIAPDLGTFNEPLGSTIPLAGSSTAFEAHVDVSVRDSDGRELGRTFVMGGANGEVGPFTGSVTIDAPVTEAGAIVFSTSSAEDGAVQEATVLPVRFAGVAGEERTYSVFFHRDEELVEVVRTGPATEGVLQQALSALVAGPVPSDGEGLSSLFSSSTADVIAGVNLAGGTAVVDLARTVNGASTSAGSALFLESLNATVFQFPTVLRVEYRLEGSCDAFWSWLQVGSCAVLERPS